MPMTAAGPAVHWHLTPEMRGRLLRSGGLPLAEWLRAGIATVIKDAPHRAIYHVRLGDLDCHVKHYRLLGLRSHLREILRPLKARREFSIAAQLKARGIQTPEPIAWGVEAGGVGPAPGWLITTTIPDAVTLQAFMEMSLPAVASADQVR